MWFFLVMERKNKIKIPRGNKKISTQEEPNDPFEILPYLAVSVYKYSEYKFWERIYKFSHSSKCYKKLYLFYHGIGKNLIRWAWFWVCYLTMKNITSREAITMQILCHNVCLCCSLHLQICLNPTHILRLTSSTLSFFWASTQVL